VFLFALPVTAFLIANIAYPVPAGGRGAWTTAGVLAGCLVLLALFQVMRYGNERMDNFTRGDAATVAAFYRDAPVGATVYGANLPWRGRHYADYDYRSIFELPSWRRARHPDPAQVVADLEEDARTNRPAIYVLVTRSMRIEAELLHNQPGVLERVARTLNALPGARRLYATRDGELFRLAPLG
jgi:hypothetical protein